MFLAIILVSFTITLFVVYMIGRYNESYWKKRGVTFYTRNKFIGPIWDFMTKDRAMFEILHDIYKQNKNKPAIGIGSFLTPALYVIDPQNIQHVLQTDFQSFNHRAIEPIKNDKLSDNILLMHGPRWKLMRQNMTPLFTSTKLKNMYYIMDKSAQDFIDILKNNPDKLKGDVFNTFSTFCSAAIGASVFGIGTKSVFDSPFLNMAQKSVEPNLRSNFTFVVSNISQWLLRTLGLKFFKQHETFFVDAIKQVLRQREKDNVKMHDFADLGVSLQKNGLLSDPDTSTEINPTDEILAAQAFFFFIAGVEPSATAIFCTVMELGRNPDILEKVHEEIDSVFDKHKNNLNYDAVMEMEYLDKVLSESLRMYPPIGFLTRKCIRDTVLPVGNIKVDKGTKIFTPVFEIHHDPKLYPNPDVFDPERFSQDTKGGDISYQPFGKGGRVCIGMRYARLQIKTGLFYILRNFTIKPIEHIGKIKFKKQQIQVRPVNVNIELIPRKN